MALGALSFAALAFAIASQDLFGYQPCALCMIQRYWHAIVVAAAGVLLLYKRRPRLFLTIQTAALIICFGYALFHVGVEQHWWEGTRMCTGTNDAKTIEDLRQQILTAPIVRCDEISWTLFGLSMAVYNAVLTACMAAYAIYVGVRNR
jgi:disulfide bond formation protein DsbB